MAGFGKYDSEYSALKALANAIGCITPQGGWDSSYSIMSDMYALLTGNTPSGDVSMIDMISTIQEGVEDGTIELGDQCTVEIARLNNIIQNLESQLDGFSEACEAEKQQIIDEKDEANRIQRVEYEGRIDSLYTEIDELNATIEDLRNGGGGSESSIDFGVIGYTEENAGAFFEYERDSLEYSKKIKDEWNPSLLTTLQFRNDTNLIYLPYIDTSNFTNMEGIFSGCNKLRTIPLLNTSKVKYTNDMFKDCSDLITIPLLDTSNVILMSNMFQSCSRLNTIPLLNTSNVISMSFMFAKCSRLNTIPQLDTSNVTVMPYIFQSCSRLNTIPLLNTSNVTDMDKMFLDCTSLTSIPQLDTSKVTDMSSMFSGCTSLTTIPQLDTSKVTNAESLFSSCSKLESLPLLDFSSVTTISSFFGYSNITTLTDLGGFTGLKINWTGSGSLKTLPNLTTQSLLNVFNTIADVNDLGGRKLELGTTNLAKLTDEEKSIATNKGWTLS